MQQPLTVAPPQKGLIISPDNPFKRDVELMQAQMKSATRSTKGEGYKRTRITVIEETEYFPGRYTKLFHNKELLGHLTPSACKMLIFIAITMDYESEMLHIPWQQVGMNRKTTSRALMELIDTRIISKVVNKKAWYWVNVTLLIIGNVNKEQK